MSTYVWMGKSLVVTWLLTLAMTTAVSWQSSVDVLVVPAVSAIVYGGLLKGESGRDGAPLLQNAFSKYSGFGHHEYQGLA